MESISVRWKKAWFKIPALKCLVNCSNLRSGGALQVALSFLEETGAHPDHRFHVILSPEMDRLVSRRGWPDNITFYPLPLHPSGSAVAFSTFVRTAKKLEQQIGPDAALTIFGPSLWRPSVPHLCGYANCLYLFPDSFFIKNIWPKGPFARVLYRLRRALSLRLLFHNCDALWVETEEAAASLHAYSGSGCPVHVIPNTVSSVVRESLLGVKHVPAPDGPFRLLTVSAPHINKNIAIIRSLLPFFEDGSVRFTVTLSDADFAAQFGVDSNHPALINTGTLHPADLAGAMAEADAAFLPSLLEVESAAYYEAMMAGLPVIASDLPFARAQCGDAALYFSPASTKDAAVKIGMLMNDRTFYHALRIRGIDKAAALPPPAFRAGKLISLLGEMAGTRVVKH